MMNRSAEEMPRLKPALRLLDDDARDQDDMCIWIHSADPTLSRIITSDKKAERLFVYGLDGRTIQRIATPKPGNISLRCNIPLGGKQVDLVALDMIMPEMNGKDTADAGNSIVILSRSY